MSDLKRIVTKGTPTSLKMHFIIMKREEPEVEIVTKMVAVFPNQNFNKVTGADTL